VSAELPDLGWTEDQGELDGYRHDRIRSAVIADLLVFRMVLPSHTVEGTLLRIVNGLSWVVAVFLLLPGLALIFLQTA